MPSVSLVNSTFRPARALKGGASLPQVYHCCTRAVRIFNKLGQVFYRCRELSSNSIGNSCTASLILPVRVTFCPTSTAYIPVCESHRRPVICGIICSRHPVRSGSSTSPAIAVTDHQKFESDLTLTHLPPPEHTTYADTHGCLSRPHLVCKVPVYGLPILALLTPKANKATFPQALLGNCSAHRWLFRRAKLQDYTSLSTLPTRTAEPLRTPALSRP
ncbi:hypothetical protein CCMA1212_003897 [Trichoderma ghanense]|uniref:Uncharacterized protein n=1 Tax=Trichoderma ghanense TaxID=65468 RepID=A0ABY2H9J3_9HYPO